LPTRIPDLANEEHSNMAVLRVWRRRDDYEPGANYVKGPSHPVHTGRDLLYGRSLGQVGHRTVKTTAITS
jgi:hypothetical protein